jgi:small subunit ribosomal protein S17
MAHDEQNQCKAGDLVLLEESPPYSRHKKWTLKEVLKIYEKKKIFRVKPKE